MGYFQKTFLKNDCEKIEYVCAIKLLTFIIQLYVDELKYRASRHGTSKNIQPYFILKCQIRYIVYIVKRKSTIMNVLTIEELRMKKKSKKKMCLSRRIRFEPAAARSKC